MRAGVKRARSGDRLVGRVALGCAIAGLLFLPSLLAACGGSSSADAAIPGKAELMQCVKDGGGQWWNQFPLLPKGFPSGTAEVDVIGPKSAHITYYVAKRPVFSKKTAEGFAEIGEYVAYPRSGGRVLVLLDPGTGKEDRELAFSCLEG
jgi:hypothetical protein